MAYFGGAQGRGDPGFFGSLFGAAKGFLTGGPVGGIAGLAASFRRPTGGTRTVPRIRTPGISGVLQRAIPGGRTGFQQPHKRRRMNVTNDKALRRAIRRQAGFVKLAKKALKGTGFQIVSSASLASSRAGKRAQEERHHAT